MDKESKDMREEDLIRKLTEGKQNPFQVPEGYFDNFTEQLMAQLPKQEKKKASKIHHLWRWAAAVAVVAGAALAVHTVSPDKVMTAQETEVEQYSEQYSNDALDYAMLNNQDIEMYLTEAQ